MHRIFVYGTLKRGHRLNGVLIDGESDFVSEAIVNSGFRLFDNGSFPYLVPDQSVTGVKSPVHEYANRIRGEMWEVSQAVLKRLDAIELGAGYTREEITTDFGPAQAYVYRRPLHESVREVPFDHVNGWTEWQPSH